MSRIHTANPGTIRNAVKRRILWCYVFLFSNIIFSEICATCKIAFFAISAGGSSSRPSPCFGEASGPAGGTFALPGPAGAIELRGGAPGANQVAATHAHPSRSPRAHTHSCHMHCHSHTHKRKPGVPLPLPRAPVGSREPAAPARGRQGGNRPDCRAPFTAASNAAPAAPWPAPSGV